MNKLFLTVREAARELDVADGTVRVAVSEGRLPAIITNGRWMIARPDLDEYLRRTRPNGIKPRGRPVGNGGIASLQGYLSQVTYAQVEQQLSEPGQARENMLLSITNMLRGMSGQNLIVVRSVVAALYEQEIVGKENPHTTED